MNTTEIQAAIARPGVFPQRTPHAIADALVQTARLWLAADSPWRARAIAAASEPTGFSAAMVNEAVTLTFEALAQATFGDCKFSGEPPHRITHILSGNVPAPSIASICRGLLLHAVNLVKSSQRDPVFPALFVESLREVDPDLAECVTVLHWPRSETNLTRAALAGANTVIVYGDDDSVASVRALTPPRARFFGYGHKISFAIVGEAALAFHQSSTGGRGSRRAEDSLSPATGSGGASPTNLGDLPTLAAWYASVYDQQGCMSPHVFFVGNDAREFAAALAEAMENYQQRIPRGTLSIEEAARAAVVREAYEFRSANDPRVKIWTGAPPYPWTVIYEEDPVFTPSCLNRTIFVKPISTLDSMQAWAGKISTVGIAPWNDQSRNSVSHWAERVCPIGQMQRPPMFG